MEGGDESAAAAALGLSPQLFVNEVLNMVDDVRREAFEYCLQEGVPEAVGGAAAAQKAEELERNDEQKEISYQYDTQVIEIKSLKALEAMDDINLFLVITILSFLLSCPLMLFTGGVKFTPAYLQSIGLNL